MENTLVLRSFLDMQAQCIQRMEDEVANNLANMVKILDEIY